MGKGNSQVEGSLNAVIVTYNNKDLLDTCISSVIQSLENTGLKGQVVVIDNNSSDGTDTLIDHKYPHVKYIRNRENFGLSRALNMGIREGMSSTFTLLMNDDVELFPETIGLMIDTLNQYPKASGIPSLLVHPDGSPQKFKLKIFGLSEVHDTEIRLVHFPGTTACLYCTDVFKKVGFFDEFYFFYNEDLDFAIRAKRKGLIFVFNPKVRVIHHRAQGRKKGERFVRPYFYATNYYFYRKNYGFLLAQLYLASAKCHIYRMRKKFKRTNNIKQGELLEQGREKLEHTVRHYRNIASKSG